MIDTYDESLLKKSSCDFPTRRTMNLALTDPFILAQDYPEALTGKLSASS